MADLNFNTGENRSRSMLLPIVLALVVLAAAGAWFTRTYVHASVTGSVDHVALYPVHTEYKRGSGILVGQNQTEDALYVIADVTLHDRSEVPLFVKSMSGTFTMDDGTEVDANVIDQNDIARLMAMFPKLKAAADSLGSKPLQRESTVAAGATGGGYVILSYNVPQSVWEKRKAAGVSIDFYHQDELTLPLPK